MIGSIRARWPSARIIGLTLVPEDTTERHGIPAYPLSAGQGAGGVYQVVWTPDGAGDGWVMRAAHRTATTLKGVRLLGRISQAGLGALRRVRDEARHLRMARRLMREIDLLIVSGGGQIDDSWGGAWGHPWALWKWAMLAKATRTAHAIVGVGAGRLDSRISRFFMADAIASSGYASYRDRRSLERLRTLRMVPAGVVATDLAFGLLDGPQVALSDSVRRERGEGLRTIGVSPMSYRDPRSWMEKDEEAYRGYVERLAGFCDIVLHSGEDRLLFLTTNRSDQRAVADVLRRLEARGHDLAGGRIEDAHVDTLPELFRAFGRVDLVVASRLHGTLLAHLADLPVVAVPYAPKVDWHMQEMGQEAHSLAIDGFTPEELYEACRRLMSESVEARAAVRRSVEDRFHLARRDIERALGLLYAPSSAGGPAPSGAESRGS